MDFTAGLMPLDTALTQMLDRITPLSATETVPLLQAFARVTAHDIISPLDVPGFDNAAMDGYAVRLSDLRDGAALPVAGKAFAGQPFHDAWPTGTCIRIMTGAPVPAGCDAVVMQEETEQTDAGVRFTAPVKAGQHIRRRGEDIAHGAVVFPAGTPLTVAELPVLASLGIADVEVVRKVRVAVFSTGDELQLPGQPLGDGQIYDTNRLAVHLMLEQLGCEVINLGIIPDDPAQLREAFIAADQQADVVISSGASRWAKPTTPKPFLKSWGDRLLEAGDQAGQTLRLRQAQQQLVLRPAGQPGFRHRHLLSAGAAAAGEALGQVRPASGNSPAGTRRHTTEKVAGPPRFSTRYSAAQPGRRAGGDHHRPSGLAHI